MSIKPNDDAAHAWDHGYKSGLETASELIIDKLNEAIQAIDKDIEKQHKEQVKYNKKQEKIKNDRNKKQQLRTLP